MIYGALGELEPTAVSAGKSGTSSPAQPSRSESQRRVNICSEGNLLEESVCFGFSETQSAAEAGLGL